MTFPPTAPVVTSGYLLDYLWGLVVVALFYVAPLGAAWRILRSLLGEAVPLWVRFCLQSCKDRTRRFPR